MTKTKWLPRHISIPGPYLCLCLSEAEYEAAMKHLRCKNFGPWINTERAHATTHHMVNNTGDMTAVVCLRDHTKHESVAVAALLVHEAVHIWQWWAESYGEAKPGAEQEAYAVQCISYELMSEFSRRLEDEQRKNSPRKR